MRLGRAPQHDLPAASPRLVLEGGEHVARGAAGRDGVGRDHRRSADHPVGEHAAGGERQRLVRPQQKRRQRVGAVGLDDRPRGPVLVLQMAVAGGGGPDQRPQGEQRDPRRARAENVDEDAPLTRQARRGGGRQGVGRRMVKDAGDDVTRGVPDGGRAEDRAGRQAPRAQRRQRDHRAGTIGAPQPERTAAGGEHERQARFDDRLAEVPVAAVERGQRHQSDDRQRDGGARAPPQPRGERQQRGAEDQLERVAPHRKTRVRRRAQPPVHVRGDVVQPEEDRLRGKHRYRCCGCLPNRQKPDLRAHTDHSDRPESRKTTSDASNIGP